MLGNLLFADLSKIDSKVQYIILLNFLKHMKMQLQASHRCQFLRKARNVVMSPFLVETSKFQRKPEKLR